MNNTYFSLRLWVNNKYCSQIFNYINSKFNVNIDCYNFDKFKICKNVFMSQSDEFLWPSLSNEYYNEKGRCYGLIHHMGILSDGTIVPCCLDSSGTVSLGNIFSDNLENVLNNDRVIKIIDGFKKNYKCEELCRHCNFLESKKES